MSELLFVFYLVAGMFKIIFGYYNIPTGIDFTLLTALILTLLMIKNATANNFSFSFSPLTRYSILFFISLFPLIIFSFTYTSSQAYVYDKTLQFFAILLGFLYPLWMQHFSIKNFFKSYILTLAILCFIFIPLFLQAYNMYLTDYIGFQQSSLKPVYESYLTMSYFIAIAFIINTFLKIYDMKARILFSLFFFISIIIMGGRGPILGIILILFLFLLFNGLKMKKPNVKTILISFLLIIILAIYASFQSNISKTFERTFDRLTSLNNISQDEAANDRLVQAEFVISKVDSEHFLLGYGFGSYGIERTGIDKKFYPHNMPLEILFELGVIGLIIYILLIILIIRKLFILGSFVPWALFLFLFFNSLKSLSLTDSRVLFGFFAIILIFHTYKRSLLEDHK